MKNSFNKPKVFLSHSKKDIAFIEKLAEDLRKCQIEPWLDSYEIRPGKHWLDEIFEYGLPTCDAIFVYLTESSISSSMVKKEMDAGLIEKLRDNSISFLPYVSNENIRAGLRADIQAIQTPVWNEDNYYITLPRAVSEIWRSYLERTVDAATKNERLKRIEAELELEKVKNQRENIFLASENVEFEYIWQYYNKTIDFHYAPRDNNTSETTYTLTANLGAIIVTLLNDRRGGVYLDQLRSSLSEQVHTLLNNQGVQIDRGHYGLGGFPNLSEDLMVYGLIEDNVIPQTNNNISGRAFTFNASVSHITTLSKKYFRFKYWLAYNKLLPNDIDLKLCE